MRSMVGVTPLLLSGVGSDAYIRGNTVNRSTNENKSASDEEAKNGKETRTEDWDRNNGVERRAYISVAVARVRARARHGPSEVRAETRKQRVIAAPAEIIDAADDETKLRLVSVFCSFP